MTRKKVIGLVAHNGRKLKMVEWINRNREALKEFDLVGTEGTAKRASKVTGLEVRSLGHGPDGGDILVAHSILTGEMDILIFFVDTKTAHGHEHDIQALIRTCVTKNIPLALNAATADCLISSLQKQ